ncbi:DEAD/DEAH box helicase [Alteromonas hispanica]|uniref:DEAD-box ATP-dependent RNA helicase RhpA n=1 Tax=Alteromonas hispanica TaxID=315421 RepID=A0A6L9MXX4_9ALTE|nr:DEAD/DEAH box helicase [Alteromonas hispanica]NDW22671.1 DEAD/DEAH box helicase [Alteromonas hispanica]
MSFSQLGLAEPLLKAIEKQGFSKPSPIQEKAIPVVMEGRDVLAAAQTGTGKTAGFGLPILHKLLDGKKASGNNVRALILTPTRELAAQVEESIRELSAYVPLTTAVVFGGVGINPQMMKLRKGVDVLIATPGRLLDLYQQNAVKFSQLEYLVLDEADRMLDMGFIHDIKKVLKLLPSQRQSLLFSATFSPEITALAQTITRDPVQISTTSANTTVDAVKQHLIALDKSKKTSALISLIKQQNWKQVLVFSRTKHGANRVADKLSKAKVPAAAIHGNKSQGARTKALSDFKSGQIDVLVATDIAARGIDISDLPIVVNLDLPNTPADYVHRIGRTGRAGASGQAWSFVSADELQSLKDIETLIQKLLPRETLDGFAPQVPVPVTTLSKPKKPKKPKAPKSFDNAKRPRGAEGGRGANKTGAQFKNKRRSAPKSTNGSGASANSAARRPKQQNA